MMRTSVVAALAVVLGVASVAPAAEISGEYLEARTCDVYTGPCFANAEMGLAGKEALMAWQVDEGSWKGVSLDGLGVALVLHAEGTLGDDGIFGMKAGKIRSVILVDQQGSEVQQQALVDFVRAKAKDLAGDVQRVEAVDIELKNDHLSGRGVLKAGKIGQIETRALKEDDCVCTNEIVYYQPLGNVRNSSPAFLKTLSYQGAGLDNRWTTHNIRSAFLATFSH
ncbi:MAG: DUF1326 domain-containing protein [Planctomycetaceae bacterium]|nr:DUF1326 domain-containing protein [Planctomycetaceae bacterium]